MNYFDCWEWKAGRTAAGYGKVTINQQHHYVHRLAYEELVGPILPEHLVHHVCRNRACYNPAHLELATNATHADNGPAKERAKTHCKHGHPFDAANTRINRRGHRVCRACRRQWANEAYAAAK